MEARKRKPLSCQKGESLKKEKVVNSVKAAERLSKRRMEKCM